MIRISQADAHARFDRLPPHKRIATLSPAYVLADSHRDPSLTPQFLCYERGDDFWMHGVHVGIVPNSDYVDFQSPYGYGGPVSNTEDEEFLLQAGRAYQAYCHEHGVLAEFVRLHPMLKQPFFGEARYNRDTVYLEPECDYSATCRNKIRKADKEGLRAIPASRQSILNFATSYREGMERLNADQFYFFSDEYFTALSQMQAAHLIVVEDEGKSWCSAGIFLEGGAFFEYHLAITNERGRKLAATNMLIDAAHTFAASRGKGLYMGGGKTMLASDPLLEFKASFGGKRMPFYVGSLVHRPDAYYDMHNDMLEVGPVHSRTLFWR